MSDEPIDPDVGPDEPAAGSSNEMRVILAVTMGGIVGAVARYEAGGWWPTATGTFPWTTFAINVCGSALIGVLLVLAIEIYPSHPLLRPLLGTGLLGGFTTFSTYAVQARVLIGDGHAGVALSYLLATVLAAVGVVTVAAKATRHRALRRPQ